MKYYFQHSSESCSKVCGISKMICKLYSSTICYYDLAFSEADRQPFSIGGVQPEDEEVDAYDIVQAMQEVQIQAHAPKSKPVDTTG